MTGLTGIPSAVGIAAIGQIPATATNDNAEAGKVGEYTSSVIASPVTLTSTVSKNLTSLLLTAGDWDVSCNLTYTGDAATTVQTLAAGFNTTTDTLPARGGMGRVDVVVSVAGAAIFPVDTYTIVVPPTRFSLASTTTVYGVANALFAVGACTVTGTVQARRIR